MKHISKWLGNKGANREAGKILAVSLLTAALIVPAPAFAQVNPEGFLQSVVDLLTGNLARLGAICAMAVCGWMWWTGRGNAEVLVRVIIGIFFVFGAAWIVDQITK